MAAMRTLPNVSAGPGPRRHACSVCCRRLALHYRFGLPMLGRTPIAAAAFERIERLGERLTPQRRWSYVIIRARRSPH
jgi:hypothetical protein